MKGVVFEGGGEAAFCHLGAVKYFQENEITFDYYAGSSSGAIIAVFAAAGFPASEIEKIAFDIKIPSTNFFYGCYNVIKNFGWLSTQFISDLIVKYFGDITLQDFEKKYGKKIVITACKNFQEEYFTSSFSPFLKLSEAVARSCAFPYVFARRNGYSDGGIINNFPYNFLANLIGEKNVTGIYLRHINETAPIISKNIFEFSYNLFNCISNDHSLNLLSKNDLSRIIIITSSLKTFSNNEEQKKEAIEKGYNTTKLFYNPCF